jgi:hypothetical protein
MVLFGGVVWLCCGCVVCRMTWCEVIRREKKHKVRNSHAIPQIFGIPRKQKSRGLHLKLLKACPCRNMRDKKTNGKQMASPYVGLLTI